MAGTLPPIVAVLMADSAQFSKAMGEAKAEMTSMEDSGSASLGGLSNIAKLGFAAVGAAIGESIKMASQFQASMERLHTQAGVSQGDIAGLSKGILTLAGQVGDSPDSLAAGLFHVESAFASTGITGAQAMDILKTAAEGAKLGGANLVDVTNALDAAIVSGIPGVDNYQHAMGVLNATVGTGDMTMQDLADALGTGVMPVVKNYGLTLTDVGAALATFGDNNIRGAQAGTQLRMAVQALAVPTKAGTAELQKLGMTSDQMATDMQHGGLVPALQDLKDHLTAAGMSADQTGQIITEIFGKKAGTGVAILYDQLDRLKGKYAENAAAATSFGSDWDAAQKTMSVQMDKFGATVQAAAIDLGTMLLPVASKVIGALTDVVDFVTRSHVALSVLAGVVTAVAAPAILNFAIALGTTLLTAMFDGLAALTSMGVQMGVFGEEAQAAAAETAAAGEEMTMSLGPIGLVAGAIAALSVAFRDNGSASRAAADYVNAFVQKAEQAPNALAVMTAKLHELEAAQAQVVSQKSGWTQYWDDVTQHSALAFLGIGNGASKSTDEINKLKAAIDQYNASQKGANDAAGQGAPPLTALQKAMAGASQSANDATDAVAALQRAIQQMSGDQVTAEQDLITFNQGLDAMTASLQKNSDNLDINTTAGQDDMTAILNNIKHVTDLSTNMAKAGDSSDQFSTALHAQVSKLHDTMVAAGLTDAKVQDLLATYGLDPPSLDTYVNLYGVSDAKQQMADLVTAANGVGAAAAAAGAELANLVAGGSAGGWGNQLSGTRVAAGDTASPYNSYAHNAGGTDFWGGGLTWVGESGPELVNLPYGSAVYPADKSQQMVQPLAGGFGASSGGSPINIYVTVQGNVTTQQDLVSGVYQGLLQLNRQHPLGFR